MFGKIRWKRPVLNEDGLSLVEILIAVTIMSIISVTLMGYFTSAVDKSSEESHRIIAANLARLKAAELRDGFKNQAEYDAVKSVINKHLVYTAKDPNILNGLLNDTIINGTTYRYLVSLDETDPLRFGSVITNPDNYLASMAITVTWSDTDPPPAKSSTKLESYIMKRW